MSSTKATSGVTHLPKQATIESSVTSLERETQRAFASELSTAVRDLAAVPTRASVQRLIDLVPEFTIILGKSLNEFPTTGEEREGITSSERILGSRSMELDRLLVSFRSYLLLNSREDLQNSYDRFSSCQPEEGRITEEAFLKLSNTVQKRISSCEEEAVLFLALIYNTAAKAPPTHWDMLPHAVDNATEYEERRSVFLKEAARSDDHVEILKSLISNLPEKLPSLSRLNPSDQYLYKLAVTSTPNLGQLLQLESMEGTLIGYSQLPSRTKDLHFTQFLAQVCGARGFESELGSLTMNEDLAQRWLNLEASLNLSDPASIYNSVVLERAAAYGIDPGTSLGRAIVRLGAMYGLTNSIEAKHLKNALTSPIFPTKDRELLISELSVTGLEGTPAIIAYHTPALLKNCKHHSLQSQSPYLQGFGRGLRALAHVYQLTRQEFGEVNAPYLDVSVRPLAAQASKLSLRPEFSVSRVLTPTNPEESPTTLPAKVVFGISPTWNEYCEALHESKYQASLPLAPPIIDNHKMLHHIRVSSQNLLNKAPLIFTARNLSNNQQVIFENKVRHTLHLATVVSLYVPPETTIPLPRDSRDNSHPDDEILLDSLKLQILCKELAQKLTPESGERLPSRVLSELLQCAEDVLSHARFAYSSPVAHQIQVLEDTPVSVFSFMKNNKSVADIHFTKAPSLLISETLSETPLAPTGTCSVIAEQTTTRSVRELEEIHSVFNRFVGLNKPIFPPLSITSSNYSTHTHSLNKLLACRNRKREIELQLQIVDEKLGLHCDTVSLVTRGASHSDDSLIWKLLEIRKELLNAAHQLHFDYNASDYTLLTSKIERANKYLQSLPSIEVRHTSILHAGTPDLTSIVSEMSELVAPYQYQRSDPRMYDQGGCAVDASPQTLLKLFMAGARCILCRTELNKLTGFCIYLPHEVLSQNFREIPDLFSTYGTTSFIWYLHVDPSSSGLLPTYDLVVNRFRLDSCAYDVATSQVANLNRPSLTMSSSSSGRGTFVPYYLIPFSTTPNKQPKFFSIGLISPLSSAWRNFSGLYHANDATAHVTAKDIVNRNIPAFYRREIEDLLILFSIVNDRREYILSRGENVPWAIRNEVKFRLENWTSRVTDFLKSKSEQPELVSRCLTTNTDDSIALLVDHFRDKLSLRDIRSFLNYF